MCHVQRFNNVEVEQKRCLWFKAAMLICTVGLLVVVFRGYSGAAEEQVPVTVLPLTSDATGKPAGRCV